MFCPFRVARRANTGSGPRGSLRAVATWEATYVGLSGMFLCFGQFALVSYIALYLLATYSIPIGIGSLYLVLANAGGAAGRLAWGSASDRLFGGRRADSFMVVTLCALAGFLLLAWLPPKAPIAILILLVALLGATVIGWNGVYVTLLSEIAKPDRRARTVAYGMTISQLGIFAGPFAFGLIVEITHSYRVAWIVVAASMLLAAAMIARVRERLRAGARIGVLIP